MDGVPLPRSAGILLHPTSLFTPFGVGDLGPAAFAFVDFLAAAGQGFWQVLPLGPTGYADSPYQVTSVFAGNPLLVSPERLVEMGLLSTGAIDSAVQARAGGQASRAVDYEAVRPIKDALLRDAFVTFQARRSSDLVAIASDFKRFCTAQAGWLEDYVTYHSLRVHHAFESWTAWPAAHGSRDPATMATWRESHHEELERYRFEQWLFDHQWKQLKTHANRQGVLLIGDMPIFVAHDSADAWLHPDMFTLDASGALAFQAGVPPDYFSATGQLWGNPLYAWETRREALFPWFLARFSRLMELVDWIRVDHFRGFQAYWKVPGTARTAENGEWVAAPGEALFAYLNDRLGPIPVIAEDLGIITPEVERLRDRCGFPGMRVLQFAFAGDATNPHLPHNYVRHAVAYTGTHDNNTTLGWWQDNATELERETVVEYFNMKGGDVVLDCIKGLYRSVASLAILPLQDVLRQGSLARMNTPSVASGNWQYMMPAGSATGEIARALRRLVSLYGRDAPHKDAREAS